MYTGRIEGKGPRYCPSLEDKVVRFQDRGQHTVFLEPEGIDSNVLYANGISTSLPVEAQNEFVRSIPGLEKAKIVQPGYAVEYTFVALESFGLTWKLISIPDFSLLDRFVAQVVTRRPPLRD